MRARDVMTTRVVSVRVDTPVEEIARTLLERHISAVPVTGPDGEVIGIVSEGDLMRRPESGTDRRPAWWLALLTSEEEQAARYVKAHGRQAKDVMTRPVITVGEETDIDEVAELLERKQIKRVPVVRDGRIVGIVSRANLLQGLATRKSPAQPPAADDVTLRTKILETLQAEAGIRDQFINITVTDGIVHLWGMVQNEAERDAIRLAAENTGGVRGIDDHLGVMTQLVRSVLWAE